MKTDLRDPAHAADKNKPPSPGMAKPSTTK